MKATRNAPRTPFSRQTQPERRAGKRRRAWGLLAYYLAGGAEKRSSADRRDIPYSAYDETTVEEKRDKGDRRKIVATKYLNCGKIMDQRAATRRNEDRVDPAAAERQKFQRLGPGWID